MPHFDDCFDFRTYIYDHGWPLIKRYYDHRSLRYYTVFTTTATQQPNILLHTIDVTIAPSWNACNTAITNNKAQALRVMEKFTVL